MLVRKQSIPGMKSHKRIQQVILLLYVVLFLADAVNVDEVLGLTSFTREDEVIDSDQAALLAPAASLNSLNNLTISSNKLQAHKTRLELVDVDSPSLQASYVSRDQVTPLILQTQSHIFVPSAVTEFSFYSLCKLQI